MKKDMTEVIKKEFERLKTEVGTYRPEAFEYLEKRFLEIYKFDTCGFRRWTNKKIRAGECPASEWLQINYYPVTKLEVELLNFFNMLTEKSKKKYLDLFRKYLFKLKNSGIFREKCNRVSKQGFNPFGIWMDKNNFNPVFIETNTD
jgi:hypothetical protein